jgi:two-component system cell cycle response regulator DivK
VSGSATAGEPLILIVDDDATNLKLARDVLRAARFRTLEAATGAEAVSLAREHLPDAVLLDLVLPDLAGTDVARQLRNDPRTGRIPIVALSVTRVDPEEEWFRAAGFAGYLAKPFDVAALPRHVEAFCGAG